MIALARPPWLRPAALLSVAAAHATAAWMFVAQPAGHDSPENAIEVAIVAQGDAPEDRRESALSEPAPQRSVPPEPQPSATPEPVSTPVAALPEAPPPPDPAPSIVAAPPPPPRPVAHQETKPPPKPKPRPKPSPAAKVSAPAAAATRGVESGAGETTAASRASYGSRLAEEVARHKVYPQSARERGVEASVGVRVTVGADGRIVSHALIRPSGDADIDAEVQTMLAAVVAPPPPDGHFTASLTIRFDLH